MFLLFIILWIAFIQVFNCNWLEQASLHDCFVSISVTQTQKTYWSETLLLLYITFKHPCMTEVMKMHSIGSAAHYECVLELCC